MAERVHDMRRELADEVSETLALSRHAFDPLAGERPSLSAGIRVALQPRRVRAVGS
jgi:hypothetical protein